jgi:hypothetical protein
MALTKASYSMIQGAVANVLDFGADSTGVASSTVAFQAAIDSLTNGGGVYVPQGTYLLNVTNGVSLDNNITMFGDGAASIIRFSTQDSFRTDGKSNIVIKDIKFKNENARLYFNNCTNVQMLSCYGDGALTTTGDLTQQGFWFAGCRDVLVENCQLVNYYNGVYLSEKDYPTNPSAFPCERVTVRGGSIIQTSHGLTNQYPTGVYGYQVRFLHVDGVYFQDIKPKTGATSLYIGYGVYEGDGTLGNLTEVKVTNCSFANIDANTETFIGILTSVSRDTVVDSCTFRMAGGIGFDRGSRNTQISNCFFDNASCYSGESTGVTSYNIFTFVNNFVINNPTTTGVIVQNTSASGFLRNTIIANNFFKNLGFGALWLRGVDFASVTDNYFEDCNTTGNANDFYAGAINFFGCTNGLVDGNTIIQGLSGQLLYGVTSANPTHAINITQNNRISGVNTSILRPLTAPPTVGSWTTGQFISNWTPSAGGTPGWVCVTGGTPGTWKAMANLAV